MSPRTRFVKVRLSPDEYHNVLQRADMDGVTMCEHIRQLVLAEHDRLDLLAELAVIRSQLVRPQARTLDDRLLREAVLLLRELAAARDAQILTRVRVQLAQGLEGVRDDQ